MTLAERYPNLVDAFTRNFCSPPRTYPDVWASQNVRLNSDVSEMYDPLASPYFVTPLRAIFDNSLWEICIVAPPGSGKSALIEAMICYIAVCDPGDVLVSSKNEKLLQQWLDTRVNRIIERCIPLQNYLPAKSDRQKALLLLKHMFVMARGASVSNFQSVSVRWALGDETWMWDAGLIGYLRKRLHDRWNGRVCLLGQAGFADTDWDYACREGDQFQYLYTCNCGIKQTFDFDNLKYEGATKKLEIDWPKVQETLRLVCPHCGYHYLDTPETRRTLSSNAQWSLVEHGENQTHQTYTIPAMANFRVSWLEILRENLKARRSWKMGDEEPLQQWTMQRASKFWKNEYHREEDSQIIKSAYSWKEYVQGERIDNEVVRFMCCDVQENNYWVVIRAWRQDGTSRLIRFAHLMGGETELRELQQTYRVPDQCVFMDSKYDTTNVYKLCSIHNWWAFAGTGSHSFAHPLKDVHGRVVGTQQLLYSPVKHVAVGKVKCKLLELASERLRDVFARLRDGKSLLFEVPSDVPAAYIDQVNAEVKKETIDPKTKHSVFRWQQVGKRNDAFDMETAGVAAAILFKVLKLD